ncbi:MAG: NAD(P)-dependent oxidoreductase, partial [Flectobacillus sp.]|nr:NAD(P)-dependent oxidoreductase [Flectobacillus sp.]
MMESQNKLFPIFLKLESLNLLIVGGGNVGLEKLAAVLVNSPEAKVTVVAGMFRQELLDFVKDYPQVILQERNFEWADLEEKDVVILATDSPT